MLFVCFCFLFLQRNSTCFGFFPFFCQGEHPASTAESEKGIVADCREAAGGPAGKGRGSCVGIFVCFIYQLECSRILTSQCSVGCFLLLWFILCVCTSVCVCGQCEHVLVCVCAGMCVCIWMFERSVFAHIMVLFGDTTLVSFLRMWVVFRVCVWCATYTEDLFVNVEMLKALKQCSAVILVPTIAKSLL